MDQPTLFDADDPRQSELPPDQAARDFAVDPRNDVVLEASAGTGKTRVLVDRYVRLIEVGVDPGHILALTFTRKAANEMRERVMAALASRAASGDVTSERWQTIRQHAGDIQISTIDAFCFGLLREFPLEADVDPAFDVADETEIGRFTNEALDLALSVTRPLLVDDEHLQLLFARVPQPALRATLATLLDRRQVAVPAVARFVRRRESPGSVADVCARFTEHVRQALGRASTRAVLIDDGPIGSAEFALLARDLGAILDGAELGPSDIERRRHRIERYFLTRDGKPRQRVVRPFAVADFRSRDAKQRHERALAAVAPAVAQALSDLETDLAALLARGLARLLGIAVSQYERLLDEHAVLDFAGMLDRSVALLERQEEFARSRLKLQSRYHHLLVDEFQDTSRRQWRLIELLVDAWAEGEGTADAPTSIFIVGDRKQSIYRFRHAEVTLLDEAAARIGALRQGRSVRQAITTSYRAVPELLAFVNALAGSMEGDGALDDRWRYDDRDRFPQPSVEPGARRDGQPVLGLAATRTQAEAASAVAHEIVRILEQVQVRDRSGGPRPARPDDIAVLFRARAGHQFYEDALEARGVRTYVYKGLGFFDAPEVRDIQALVRYLARPDSDLRAAEFLRSRFVRLSDTGLARLAPAFSSALLGALPAAAAGLGETDASLLALARPAVSRWLASLDRRPPSEVIDRAIDDSAFVFEMRGRRLDQARENLKKVRSLVRRLESRGYATIGRLAAYFETLRFGDDSHAVVEAADAVNLMTIHAAKGLEFPIVFVVNLQSGARGRPAGPSVIERGPTGEPEVSFGASEATRLEDARETEELRRLLYVATTRARDRLYLSAEVDAHGALRRSARSLASLLPATLAGTLTAAAGSEASEVEWETDRGRFAFGVCRPPAEVPSRALPDATAGEEATGPLAALEPRIAGVVPATAVTGDPARPRAGRPRRDRRRPDDRWLGILVHRMLQRGVDPDTDAKPQDLALSLLAPEERVDLDRPERTAGQALARYRAAHRRHDIAALLGAGATYFEVPVSFAPVGAVGPHVRGVIDCVVIAPDGGATVLEFKTGDPRPDDEVQATFYRRALEASGAFSHVEARVLYV